MTFSTLPGQADALTCDMEGVPVDASNLVIKVDNGQQARSTKYTKSWSRRLVSLPQSVADVGWFPDTCLASLLLHANFFSDASAAAYRPSTCFADTLAQSSSSKST